MWQACLPEGIGLPTNSRETCVAQRILPENQMRPYPFDVAAADHNQHPVLGSG